MTDDFPFSFFDRNAEFTIRSRHLPHWVQNGATYFVTMSLSDSISRKVGRQMQLEIDDWARRHHFDPTSQTWREELSKNEKLSEDFRRRFRSQYERWLDKGYGACVLADPVNAETVVSSLRYFEGTRSKLGPFVVMPNHLHALLAVLDDQGPESLCRSWRRFTATKINRRLNRRGDLWFHEGFDHLVRSAASFEKFRRYIFENPRKANLAPGSYRLGDGMSDQLILD